MILAAMILLKGRQADQPRGSIKRSVMETTPFSFLLLCMSPEVAHMRSKATSAFPPLTGA